MVSTGRLSTVTSSSIGIITWNNPQLVSRVFDQHILFRKYQRNCHLFLHNSIQQAVEVHEEAHHLPAHVQTHTNLTMRILSSTSSYPILKLRSTQLKFVKFLLIFAFLTMCLRSCPALWISAGSYSPGKPTKCNVKELFKGEILEIFKAFITCTYISPWNKVELTDEPNTNLEV